MQKSSGGELGSGELFRRYPGNPILTADLWPETVNTVFNPGVATYEGETILLVRVEDRSGLSRLCVARSRDGDSGVEHGVHRFGPKISGQYRIAWIASKEFTTAQFAPG